MESTTSMDFPATMSDRERDDLMRAQRQQELETRRMEEELERQKGHIFQENEISVDEADDTTVPKGVKRDWVCSKCKHCEMFTQKSGSKACECGCELVYHLKTEDEYEVEALDDLDDEFDEFE